MSVCREAVRGGVLRAAVLTGLVVGLSGTSCALAQPLSFTGISLAGGEFYEPKPEERPKYGTNFLYPNEEEITYFAAQGMNVFRYPFRWETVQAKAGEPLVTEEVARLKACVKLATDRGCVVILDPHNYARYRRKLKENGIGGTYWAAGPWWGNYPLSVEPRNGQDRPQMAVLLKYAAPGAGK